MPVPVVQYATVPGTLSEDDCGETYDCGDCDLPEGSSIATDYEFTVSTALLTLSAGSRIVGTGCEVIDLAECCDESTPTGAYAVVISYVEIEVSSVTYSCEVDPDCCSEPVECRGQILPSRLILRIQLDEDFIAEEDALSCPDGDGEWGMSLLLDDSSGGYDRYWPEGDEATVGVDFSTAVWANHIRQLDGLEIPIDFFGEYTDPSGRPGGVLDYGCRWLTKTYDAPNVWPTLVLTNSPCPDPVTAASPGYSPAADDRGTADGCVCDAPSWTGYPGGFGTTRPAIGTFTACDYPYYLGAGVTDTPQISSAPSVTWYAFDSADVPTRTEELPCAEYRGDCSDQFSLISTATELRLSSVTPGLVRLQFYVEIHGKPFLYDNSPAVGTYFDAACSGRFSILEFIQSITGTPPTGSVGAGTFYQFDPFVANYRHPWLPLAVVIYDPTA